MQKLTCNTDKEEQTDCCTAERPKIAVFLNGISSYYPAEISEVIARQAEEFGFCVLFFASDVRDSHENNEGELKLFSVPDMRGFDGIIVATSTIPNTETVEYLKKELPEDVPIVSIGPPIGRSFSVSLSDNGCMETLVRHFIEVHRFTRINFISGPPGNPDSEYRLSAYKKIMTEYGLAYDDRIFIGDFTRESARDAIGKFILDDLPEAIVCANDEMALSAHAELIRLGFSVPEDIALSGFDCIHDAEHHVPRITTVRQPLTDMGRRAIQIIHDLITGKRVKKEYTYDSHVIIGGSCGCVDKQSIDERQLLNEFMLDTDDMRINNFISTSMMELLTGSYSLQDIIDQLTALAHIMDFRHLYFCVDEDILMSYSQEQYSYSDEMTLMLGIVNGNIHTGLRFKTKDILPRLDKTPTALVFAPLYFKNNTFGYIAFDFDRSSTSMHRIWVKNVSLALENLRTQNALRQYAEENIRLALYDHLTGLPNRLLFTTNLNRMIEQTKTGIYVFFIDIDYFKRINDTLGHAAGDELLKQAGKRISAVCGNVDSVCRVGGDEFLVMIRQKSEQQVIVMAERLLDRVSKPFVINKHQVMVTCSIGIAKKPQGGMDAELLIKNADFAMYNAKKDGKNRFKMFSAKLEKDANEENKVIKGLQDALKNNEFVLYYQPQVDGSTMKTIGYEALIRWNHPTRGMVQPNDFIPIAERTGLILPIGEWVIRTACRQNKEWQDMGLPKVPVAVNISAVQINNNPLHVLLREALNESGLEPQYLELEVTESMIIFNEEISTEIEKIKAMGVKIAIDDFGTGYSAIQYLKNFSIDRLKIPMDFIHGIDLNEKDESIVSIILALAESLHINVIAEGVETESQYTFLRKRSCPNIQGFFFYHPMPAEKVIEIMKK